MRSRGTERTSQDSDAKAVSLYSPQKAYRKKRAEAGKEASAKEASTKESKRDATKKEGGKRSPDKEKQEPTMKLFASAYFLEWQQTALQAYTRSINELYVKPLLEHVTHRKVKDDGKDIDWSDERDELAKGPELDEGDDFHLIQERLKAAIKLNWENDGLHPRAGEQMSTLAEMAAMHRLRSLVQMSGQLLEVMDRTSKWMMKNIQSLTPHAATLNLIPYVVYSLEAVSALSEVFGFTPMDRSKCKSEFTAYLRTIRQKEAAESSKRTKDQKIEIKEKDVRGYVKKVEAQCNCYRTSVYIIATCLSATLQCTMRAIGAERLDVRPREVNTILDRLPPPFLWPGELKLTAYVKDLMDDAPPRKHPFPMPPKGKPADESHRADPDVYSDASVKSPESIYKSESIRSNVDDVVHNEKDDSKEDKEGDEDHEGKKDKDKSKDAKALTTQEDDSVPHENERNRPAGHQTSSTTHHLQDESPKSKRSKLKKFLHLKKKKH